MGTKIRITDITNKEHDIKKDEISSLKFDNYTNTLEVFLNGIEEPIKVADKDGVLYNKIFDLMTENANVIDIP